MEPDAHQILSMAFPHIVRILRAYDHPKVHPSVLLTGCLDSALRIHRTYQRKLEDSPQPVSWEQILTMWGDLAVEQKRIVMTAVMTRRQNSAWYSRSLVGGIEGIGFACVHHFFRQGQAPPPSYTHFWVAQRIAAELVR